MNLTITFRHLDTSEAVKKHAREKCSKLQKFLRQPMTARVTLSLDKLKHVVEARISSGGEHYEARASTEDMYVSIDRVITKLERQIRGNTGAAQAKKRRSGATLRGGKKPTPIEPPATEAPTPRGVKKKTAKKAAKAKKVARPKKAQKAK